MRDIPALGEKFTDADGEICDCGHNGEKKEVIFAPVGVDYACTIKMLGDHFGQVLPSEKGIA